MATHVYNSCNILYVSNFNLQTHENCKYFTVLHVYITSVKQTNPPTDLQVNSQQELTLCNINGLH